VGFRTGLLIGALATAVVALAVAVAILASDDSGSDGSTSVVAKDDSSVESMGEPEVIRRSAEATGTTPVSFQTPSGNIGCRVESTSVRCDIFNFDWDPPPVPSSCEVPSSWGHSIELDRSGSTFLCTTQPLFNEGDDPNFPILDYGEAVGVGAIACESRERALICVAKSSRGFRLSVEEIKLF
jgi:hypothetical protein